MTVREYRLDPDDVDPDVLAEEQFKHAMRAPCPECGCRGRHAQACPEAIGEED